MDGTPNAAIAGRSCTCRIAVAQAEEQADHTWPGAHSSAGSHQQIDLCVDLCSHRLKARRTLFAGEQWSFSPLIPPMPWDKAVLYARDLEVSHVLHELHSIMDHELDPNNQSLQTGDNHKLELTCVMEKTLSTWGDISMPSDNPDQVLWSLAAFPLLMCVHSDTPNVTIKPAQEVQSGVDLNLQVLEISATIAEGGTLCCDYLSSCAARRNALRSARLCAWLASTPCRWYSAAEREMQESILAKLQQFAIPGVGEPEELPPRDVNEMQNRAIAGFCSSASRPKLLCKSTLWRQHLDIPGVSFADYAFEATAIFSDEPGSWEGAECLVNSFPFEGCLVRKDLLPQMVRRFCRSPDAPPLQPAARAVWWFPVTFDLSSELHHFLVAAQELQSRGERPVWIVKLADSKKSHGHQICREVVHVVRCMQLSNEARVVQRYLERPLLLRNKKFDIRAYVFVRSFLEPFEAYVYTRMHARLANSCYLDAPAHDRSAHFTCGEHDENWERWLPEKIAVEMWEQAGIDWHAVEADIRTALGELFWGAGFQIGVWPLSRALYGVDVMIDSTDLTPSILEVNFCPDLMWCVPHYPGFINTLCTILYTDRPAPRDVTLLLPPPWASTAVLDASG